MNSARLAELNHQRALVREQLAWLEREISKENGLAPGSSGSTVAQAPVQLSPSAQKPVLPQVITGVDEYHPDPISAASETRRGCLVAVAIGALVMIAVMAAIYFLRYSDRPLLFVASEPEAHDSSAPNPTNPPPKK